jgi:hypothetical protein
LRAYPANQGPAGRRRSASFSLEEAGQPGLQSSSFQRLIIFSFSRKTIRVKVAARTFELSGAGLDADKKVPLLFFCGFPFGGDKTWYICW